MKTRILHTKFWSDNYITTLNHREKLLFLYLITNDKVNLCGVYELPDKYILNELDFTPKKLDKIKQKLQEDGKFIFNSGWIVIKNVDKYNQYVGEKNEIAKHREISLIPSHLRDTLSIGYSEVQDTPSNKKSEIKDKKSVIKNQKSEEGLEGLGKTIEGLRLR